MSLDYNYNSKGYLTSIVRGGFIPNNTTKQNQTYNMAYDALGNMTSMSVGSRNLVLSRLYTRQIAGGIKETFVYAAGAGTSTTTPLVCTKNLKVNGVNTANLKYFYNDVGNISKAENGTNSTSVDYTYDAQGQLLSTVHKSSGTTTRTETYSYDTYGNIRSFNNGTRSQEYIYGNTDWKDLLTGIKIDNQTYSLTYDNIGNPTSYFNGTRYSMSWSEGRRLSSLTAGGNTTTYTYDLNGLRNKKVNSDGTWVKYFIADGKIIGETRYPASGGYLYDMRYTFDENGDVCGISIWNNGDNHWTRYYFLKSLQGDVLAVYQYGDNFTKVAEYTYDSWGNVLTKSGALADINPFRYRSYYQDSETGFYYLQSRYYDPAIGRFLNADVFASTGQDFLGYNMFAYCGNNPINSSDPTGTMATWIAGALIGAIVGGVSNGISSALSGGSFWKGAAVGAFCGAVAGGLGGAIKAAKIVADVADKLFIGIRFVSSALCNVGTMLANGERDATYIASSSLWDAFTDGCFSCISYFYNPFEMIGGMLVDATIDGLVDIGEPALYSSYSSQAAASQQIKCSLTPSAMHRLTLMERRCSNG